ncbi:MAG: chromate efflux transporter [Gemmatimonadaceae bacterium]
MSTLSAPAPSLPLRAGLPAWTAIALESFGGPVAQIAVLHRVIVIERRWVSEEQFQHALSFCMLLPGPEAQQLATYLGWRLHGMRGAVVAGSLFVLPGFVTLLGLSLLYVYAADTGVAQGVLAGIKPAVVAMVAHATGRLAPRMLGDGIRVTIALGAFAALFLLRLPFPLVLAIAAVIGVLRFGRSALAAPAQSGTGYWRRPFAAGLLWLTLWLLPLVTAGFALGWNHVIVQEGRFFATSALVTFGGAYAVLTYVAQEAVHRFHWLSPSEMLTGLGFAESTPGPLIQVVQFVAFLGAFRAPHPLDPLAAGIAASLLVTWVTFVPSFFFILGLGPFVERAAQNRWLLGALRGITAAVLGAMLNLALWFALHTFFADVREVTWGVIHLTTVRPSSFNVWAFVIAALAFTALLKLRAKHIWLLAGAAAAGLLSEFGGR